MINKLNYLNMSSVRWRRFFVESGLPSDVCDNYAVIFSENRIRFDMLEELNKEILYDMGIKKLGDIISIIRHAKEVHSSYYKEKVFATDEVNDDQKQIDTARPSKYHIKAADSTISNEKLKSGNNVMESRRIIIGSDSQIASSIQTSTVANTSNSKIRRSAPIREPIVIRDVSGLTGEHNLTIKRKRVEPPEAFKTNLNTKMLKNDFTPSSKIVRNRVDAQSRLSNFSKEIQKAIISNKNTPSTVVSDTVPVKSRLELKPADSTTITIRGNKLERKNVKARLGSVRTVKDRLGKSPAFDGRIITTNGQKSVSVFSRLGN